MTSLSEIFIPRLPVCPLPATLEIELTRMIPYQVRDVKNPPTLGPGLCLGTNGWLGSPGDAAWRAYGC
jgi:hypothetical protein